MANLVTGGLGLPEEGSLVAGGMGATAPEAPGAISANLSGSASVTASLTNGATPPEPEPSGGGSWPLHYFTPRPAPVPTRVANITATLTGSSRVMADATTTEHLTGFDDLAFLLALELV